jgi:hypothetical protein
VGLLREGAKGNRISSCMVSSRNGESQEIKERAGEGCAGRRGARDGTAAFRGISAPGGRSGHSPRDEAQKEVGVNSGAEFESFLARVLTFRGFLVRYSGRVN